MLQLVYKIYTKCNNYKRSCNMSLKLLKQKQIHQFGNDHLIFQENTRFFWGVFLKYYYFTCVPDDYDQTKSQKNIDKTLGSNI